MERNRFRQAGEEGSSIPAKTARLASRWVRGRVPAFRKGSRELELESAYCAEVVAVTYEAMGLLSGRRPNWYDPGRFWSGDRLPLAPGVEFGGEIEVVLDEDDLAAGRAAGSAS